MIFPNLTFFRSVMERFARTADSSGWRSYQNTVDRESGPLCDEHGHLIVRSIDAAGFSGTLPGSGPPLYIRQIAGSAPAVDNLGLIGNQRVMLSPDALSAGSTGVPTLGRLFGYSDAAGFVQVHLRDEQGGDNPPALGDVPEVIIPIGIGQNFVFSNYTLTPGVEHLATYLTFSSTGPTFTPAAEHLWFYFSGMV